MSDDNRKNDIEILSKLHFIELNQVQMMQKLEDFTGKFHERKVDVDKRLDKCEEIIDGNGDIGLIRKIDKVEVAVDKVDTKLCTLMASLKWAFIFITGLVGKALYDIIFRYFLGNQ